MKIILDTCVYVCVNINRRLLEYIRRHALVTILVITPFPDDRVFSGNCRPNIETAIYYPISTIPFLDNQASIGLSFLF
jgi:hypothetical protein